MANLQEGGREVTTFTGEGEVALTGGRREGREELKILGVRRLHLKFFLGMASSGRSY